jgi:hypothetical protein
MTFSRPSLLALLLSVAASAQALPLIGPLQGDAAGQAPMGLSTEGFDRFDTELIDALAQQLPDPLAALAAGQTGALYASGSSITLRYVGTGAAREASLFWGSSGNTLFDTRLGCVYANGCDEFGVIETIGKQRSVSGLAVGERLNLGLLAQAQGLGSPAEQRANAETFWAGSHSRVIDLGQGQWLLGFEEGQDASYNDMVFLVSGASLQAPVPEPSGAALALGGLTLFALLRRRQARR